MVFCYGRPNGLIWATPGDLLEMQISELRPRPTESETLGLGPSSLYLTALHGILMLAFTAQGAVFILLCSSTRTT